MITFRTRARTVDMLGRQQIAGVPTAISELFKNAHDAYADTVQVDFYRWSGLFVLRDDGVGMTRTEFESRWLTLGTESKTASSFGISAPPLDETKAPRPILGEKGIGRLAIAAIGHQVLVLTRAKYPDRDDQLVACLINWKLFELPGIDLDEIPLPLQVFPGGTLPTENDIRSLVEKSLQTVQGLRGHTDPTALMQIEQELRSFRIDVRAVDDGTSGPSLRGNGYGTQFYIAPVDEALLAAIDSGSRADGSTAPLYRMLLGFTNTMTPGHGKPKIRTLFRDHAAPDQMTDLISEDEFFTPAEFANTDHHIQGRFDDFGQFVGQVEVYGERTDNYIVNWLDSHGIPVDCGPFDITVAVVQGTNADSTLPTGEWLRMRDKMDRIGGLYVYRDGIRVLPYGNTDYDFLDIELNRTKSASYYYFSYRRIFGAIELTRERNGALHEKAGREGFRENRAYRQFRDILKNFFLQLAADFFREGGVYAVTYEEKRAEFDRIERARRAREKQVSAKRRAFATGLESAFRSFADSGPEKDVESVLGQLVHRTRAAETLSDQTAAATILAEAEDSAERNLAIIRDRYRVAGPRGVALPKKLRREYDAYRAEYKRIIDTVLEPARVRISDLVDRSAKEMHVDLDKHARFIHGLDGRFDESRRRINSEAGRLKSSAETLQQRIAMLAKKILEDFDFTARSSISDAAKVDSSKLPDKAFLEVRSELEDRIASAAELAHDALANLADEIDDAAKPEQSDGAYVTSADVMRATEEELLELRERADADLELSQLGMALEVINHEFAATITAVRRSLKRLKRWADANETLRAVYQDLRNSFDHLDGYLTLFTPLQRRLYRKPVEMVGSELHEFLKDLFAERIGRDDIALDATPEFQDHRFVGYPSTIYPAFVNIVDNALFWLSTAKAPRHVVLDASSDAMYISNNGPAIAPRDHTAIFDRGFTRKQGGRGLGLQISREALKHEDYSLVLIDPRPGMKVTFAITQGRQHIAAPVDDE